MKNSGGFSGADLGGSSENSRKRRLKEKGFDIM